MARGVETLQLGAENSPAVLIQSFRTKEDFYPVEMKIIPNR
jgi:hypothetical protein